MWHDASNRAAVNLHFISMELLSRSTPAVPELDLIIVDEAHHFRNSGTIRYRRLSRLAAGRRLLLMTATPIHNSKKDLMSLARIFLGRRADRLTASETARLIVRRGRDDIVSSSRIPDVVGPEWMEVPDRAEVTDAILSLPPAAPRREGGEATALIAHGFLRQWASSEAALRTALQRRLTAALALTASLEAGRYPSAKELKSWLASDDCVQLGFAEILSPVVDAAAAPLLEAIRAHAGGLRAIAKVLGDCGTQDAARASRIHSIVERHRGSKIVAFASYQSTVAMFFTRLSRFGRVAALTADGGRVSGGKISRDEILRQFSPEASTSKAEEIQLLLTTDLLSEGVNLQLADVVVHLDLPWTSARLEQRVGRAARIGSPHERVTVYGLSPPRCAEGILHGIDLLQTKHRAAVRTIGQSLPLGFAIIGSEGTRAIPAAHEKLRSIVSGWDLGPKRPLQVAILASVFSKRNGFLALIRSTGRPQLIGGDNEDMTDDAVSLLDLAEVASGDDRRLAACDATEVLGRIDRWFQFRRAAATAGVNTFLDTRRRIFDRLSAILDNSSPASRPSVVNRVEAARRLAAQACGSAAEKDLERLARDKTSTDEVFLAELTKLRQSGSAFDSAPDAHDEILAVLVLSTPPPAS